MLPKENVYDDLFKKFGEANSIDWLLLKAQVKQESRFNTKAVSRVGAKGLSQFMPATWNEWGHGDVFDPEFNLNAQARYMAWLLKQLKDMDKSLAAYNFGIGNVKKNKPYPKETLDYVKRINKYYQEYKKDAPVKSHLEHP